MAALDYPGRLIGHTGHDRERDRAQTVGRANGPAPDHRSPFSDVLGLGLGRARDVSGRSDNRGAKDHPEPNRYDRVPRGTDGGTDWGEINIVQDLSHDDISFLFRKDILSGEMLTASINGTFMLPDLKTMALTLARGISRPGLLLKLNKATTVGTKILKHYLKYPESWNPAAFAAWRTRAEGLFGK